METSARTIQERVVVLVYVIGLYMSALDTTIVNTALPSITRDLPYDPRISGVGGPRLSPSLAVCIPCSGWLGDRFGTKRVYLASLCVFTGASVLCGLAPTLNQLIFFRVIQGLGGGSAGARRSGHALPDVWSGQAGPGGGNGGARHQPRPPDRAGARRHPGDRAVLALVLLRQRALRHRGVGRGNAVPRRASRAGAG